MIGGKKWINDRQQQRMKYNGSRWQIMADIRIDNGW